MSNLKHTPGPWNAWQSSKGHWNVANNMAKVKRPADICQIEPGKNCKKDAKLIAAAPELLDALQKAKEFIGRCADWTGEDPPCELIDNAIKKATE